MTKETAEQILREFSQRKAAGPGFTPDFLISVYQAHGFLAGAASRDEEIGRYKKTLERIARDWHNDDCPGTDCTCADRFAADALK